MLKSGSNLEKVINEGKFAVTAELGPPMSADREVILKKVNILKGYAHAVNITDNQTAVVRMSSIGAAILVNQQGLEPVMQMVGRDRNRLAMQSDILGASAHGLKNILCIAGDHQSFGAAGKLKGHPQAKNVYDIDTINQISMFKKMRDDQEQLGGDKLEGPVPLFIGASWTPMGDPIDFRIVRLAKKVKAGADFIQTQGVYDMKAFAESMKQVVDRGLHEKTAILAGIIVPKTAGMLKYMNNFVAGVTVPSELIDRMAQAKDRRTEEAIKITVELIQQSQEIEGVKGVHIQAIEWEEAVPEIIKEAGLTI
ncbi:MAG: methylenetetrahydrofolate reductase [bacterium]